MPTARRCLLVVLTIWLIAIGRPAAATVFTYTIECCYWNSSFDSLGSLPTTGTFSYDSDHLVPLAPSRFQMGADTVLRLDTGPYFVALDPSLGPVFLMLGLQDSPGDDSRLDIAGSYATNVPVAIPSTSMLLRAIRFNAPISAGTDLSVPLDFTRADISLSFPGIGSFTANGGFHLISEPPGAAWLGIGLIALLAAWRRCMRRGARARLAHLSG